MSKLIKIVLAIVVFVLLHLFVRSQFVYDGEPIEEWTLSGNGEVRSIVMPFSMRIDEPGIYSLERSIDVGNNDSLIIPQALGYAIRVYANEHIIYQNGSFNKATANIWSKIHLVMLEQYRNETVDIRIETYGLHDIGIQTAVYLSVYENVYERVSMQNFLNITMIYTILGGYIAVGALLLLLAIKAYSHSNHNDIRLFAFFGLACLSFGLFLADGSVRMTTGSLETLLITRKVSYTGLYLGVFCLIIGIRRYMYNKATPKWVAIIFGLACLTFIIAPNFNVFHVMTNALSVFLFICLNYIVIISLRNKKGVMIFSSMFLFATSIHSIFLDIKLIEGSYLFHYGLFVYMMAVAYIIANKYEIFEEESIKLNKKMMTDPLTKAYNRAYIMELKMSRRDQAIFIDLDHFKAFNDNHGHDKGDELLIHIVRLFNKVIGDRVDIIRYGGDEFVLILRDYGKDSIESLMVAIKNQLQLRFPDADFSYGFIKYDGNIADTLIQADHLMYSMKKAKHDDAYTH